MPPAAPSPPLLQPASEVPATRLRVAAPQPLRPGGDYVLYWCISARRCGWNFALQRAADWARALGRPLLFFEALRCDHPWASARLHSFVIQGMADNAAACAAARVGYYPYLEPRPGAGRGLLEGLMAGACVVVSDEFPCFFLPAMLRAAAARSPVRLEAVDGNGLLPLAAAEQVFSSAYALRRFLQKELPAHLGRGPRSQPLAGLPAARVSLAPEIARRWPPAPLQLLRNPKRFLAALPVDHAVAPAAQSGGSAAAVAVMNEFAARRLADYAEARNSPDLDGSSGLSPYLHFGHVSAHQVFDAVARRENWSPLLLSGKARGARQGWWGLSAGAEAFLDQLVTWRELGYNFCAKRGDYDRFDSLPEWAKATLRKHAADPRTPLYDLQTFEAAATSDPLWNAAQRQLQVEGRIHNYLRMLWGKKILEWSRSPEQALEIMIQLNNKYALDGRDPNSYSGIFWTLGRYDRPWGPERPVFGTVRYMSSANTARKLALQAYLRRYGQGGGGATA